MNRKLNIAITASLVLLLSGCGLLSKKPSLEEQNIFLKERPSIDNRLLTPCLVEFPTLVSDGSGTVEIKETLVVWRRAKDQYDACAATHLALRKWVCDVVKYDSCPR